MGGASSLFEQTDWDKADGQLRSNLITIDGAPPTTKFRIYYITKRGVNQRDFDVTDQDKNLLYTTRAVPGTIACFDVLGREMEELLLRVSVDIARRYWIVHRFNYPAFAGQKPDMEATSKLPCDLADRLLYKRCCITVSWSRYMAVAALYGPPTLSMLAMSINEKLKVANGAEDEAAEDSEMQQQHQHNPLPLQQKTAKLKLPLSIPSKSKSKSSCQETYARLSGIDEDEVDDEFALATKIASRMKNRRGTESPSSEPPAELSTTMTSTLAATATEAVDTRSATSSANAITTTNAKDESSNTMPATAESTTPVTDIAKTTIAAGRRLDSQADKQASDDQESFEIPHLPDDDEEAPTSTGHFDVTTNQPARSRRATSDDAVDFDDAHSVSSSTTGDVLHRSQHQNDSADSSWDAIQSSHSMPELSHVDTSVQFDAADLITSSKSEHYSPASSGGAHGSEGSPRVRSPRSKTSGGSFSTSSITAGLGKKLPDTANQLRSWLKQQSDTFREKSQTYLYSSKPGSDQKNDPLEGVIHLDKPLLFCQEIYTKIIGNHQTSVVSKEKVLEMLRQDMAQHVKENPDEFIFDEDNHNTTNDPLWTDGAKGAEATKLEDQVAQHISGVGRRDGGTVAMDDGSPGHGVPECKDASMDEDYDNSSSCNIDGDDDNDVDRKVQSDNSASRERESSATRHLSYGKQKHDKRNEKSDNDEDKQPLVAYWKWEHTLRTQRMKMHLAQGADLALHVVLAIIVNQVRIERNAVAMTL